MNYTYCSNFADRIKSFIAHKNTLGFPYEGSAGILRHFDMMCCERFPKETVLTEEICNAWAIKKDTESNNSFGNRLSIMREFARYLLRNGEEAYVLPANIVKYCQHYPPYIYSEDEILRIWEAYDCLSIVVKYPIRNYLFSVMVKLMYCCGLRPWEPRRLRVCDVDLKKGRLNIMDSKQHRSRIVMMSDDVTKLLIECDKKVSAVKSEREAFFPSYRGNFYAKYGMEEVFRNILRETGIAGNNGHNPRLYDFRHTFATHRLYQWMREGKDVKAMIPYLSAYMGHSQISSTYYYIHFVPELLEEMAGFDFSAAEYLLPEVGSDE